MGIRLKSNCCNFYVKVKPRLHLDGDPNSLIWVCQKCGCLSEVTREEDDELWE